MKENYEELSGKSLICRHNDKYFHVVVVGCDPDIGITIKHPDREEYFFCLNGPLSPLYKGTYPQCDKLIFETVASRIESGYLDLNELLAQLYAATDTVRSGGYASHDTCPFGQ